LAEVVAEALGTVVVLVSLPPEVVLVVGQSYKALWLLFHMQLLVQVEDQVLQVVKLFTVLLLPQVAEQVGEVE
jgi:hypothetical protein